MTRTPKPSPAGADHSARRPDHAAEGSWALQYAEVRFSEFVRHVRSNAPQRVMTRGCDSEEFRRLKGERTGEALLVAMQASPYHDLDIEPRCVPMPVRDVNL